MFMFILVKKIGYLILYLTEQMVSLVVKAKTLILSVGKDKA